MNNSKRVLDNTWKQIQRSGWIAWSSIAVMTVAFLVGTIFAGLAVVLQLAIQSIETRDNIIVLFEVGTEPSLITELEQKWSDIPQIKAITYTTEEEAYQLYYEDTKGVDPVVNAALESQDEKKLDSSLDIQLYSLHDIDKVTEIIESDIRGELAQLDYDETQPPIQLLVDDESIESYKEAFSVIRALMIGLLSLLFVIIFFFILMTVEYRTYNRMEEIGVMQLVGGSLAYIRAPYILEGGFYGAVGAALSTLIIGVIYAWLFVIDSAGAFATLVAEWTRGIALPDASLILIVVVVSGIVVFGGFLGSLISYIAIRRYIK